MLSGVVRVISGVLTLSLVLLGAAGLGGMILYKQFTGAGPLQEARTVVIPKGEGRIEIADILEREGVISNRWTFIASHLYESWLGDRKNYDLKAGEYEFKPAASMREVLAIIAEGKSVAYKVTVPEGLTSQQIIERLNADTTLSGDITQIPAEGTLSPDTYGFSKGADRQEILNRMVAQQTKDLDEAWERRSPDVPIESKEQALILASVVEKETGRADERERVAAVFHNRLKKRMRLQSDPTIIYGIVGGTGPLGRSLTRSDIDQKTAYNTYQINGLPPGPICNPGKASIEATLNPAKTNDLYFVADGTGGHTFSETLKEHNQAVATWRKVEKDQKSSSGTDGDGPQPASLTTGSEAPDTAAIPNPSATDDPLPAAAASPAKTSTVPLPVRKPQR